MKQHELAPALGSKRRRKRVGRGYGSGHGAQATRGHKGQKARSGGNIPPRFEGGQLPITQRLPQKRGFTNIFRIEYAIVNLEKLAVFAPGEEVTPERLVAAGLVKSLRKPIKILGEGDFSVPITVKANKFSASARRKIEAAGGRVEEVTYARSHA